MRGQSAQCERSQIDETIMSSDDIVRCHCNGCSRSTDHALIDRRVVEDNDEPDENDDFPPYWWTDTYETLQCLGCGSVCLKQHTKEASDATTTQFFAPPVARGPPIWRWHLPDGMKELLGEVYVAIHSGSRRLALMGTRTLLDMLLLEEVGDTGSFDSKLKALRDKGVISERNREVLSTALDAGSAAAHRGYKPSREELDAVMDVVENVLQSTHHLVRVAEEFLSCQ